jgi:hypothetical protein
MEALVLVTQTVPVVAHWDKVAPVILAAALAYDTIRIIRHQLRAQLRVPADQVVELT